MKRSVCFIAVLAFIVGVLLIFTSFGLSITTRAVSEIGIGEGMAFPILSIGLLIALLIFIAVINNLRD